MAEISSMSWLICAHLSRDEREMGSASRWRTMEAHYGLLLYSDSTSPVCSLRGYCSLRHWHTLQVSSGYLPIVQYKGAGEKTYVQQRHGSCRSTNWAIAAIGSVFIFLKCVYRFPKTRDEASSGSGQTVAASGQHLPFSFWQKEEGVELSFFWWRKKRWLRNGTRHSVSNCVIYLQVTENCT